MTTTLYTVVEAYGEEDFYTITTDGGTELEFLKPIACPHPEEWAEFCIRRYGEVRNFYLPAFGRIYKSRSGAVDRANLINYWGGKAEVVETSVAWEPLGAGVARRKAARVQARIDRKRAELASLEAQLVGEVA